MERVRNGRVGVGWNLCSSAERFRNEFSHLHLAVQARVLLCFLYSLSSLFPPSHCVPCLVELAASGGFWRWSFIKGPVVMLITDESEHRYSCYLGCDYIAFPHTFIPMK